MEVSNFTSPLAIIQTISIFNYMERLSDFLYTENSLSWNETHKPIPVINSLCNYLEKHHHNQKKKLDLIRELLRDSDLFGENANETPDIQFVDTLFDHIIEHYVFEKFSNKYKFLAVISRFSNESWWQSQPFHSYLYLLNNKFENNYGPPSRLNECSRMMIFNNLFGTMFPSTAESISSDSAEFIYAQAGLMFFRSVWINQADYSRTNTFDTERYNDHVLFSKDLYDEYIGVALTIEHLVITGRLDESALRIFALPALFHYVHEKRGELRNESVRNIMRDPSHWEKAFRLLFSHLNKKLEDVEVDARHQFQLAMLNFKNLTTLAQVTIEKYCPTFAGNAIKDEVTKYVKNPKNYTCMDGIEPTLLPDIEQLYKNQNENIANKYYLLEMESLGEAFGHETSKESTNGTGIIVFRGRLLPTDHASHKETPLQLELSDDVFLFNHPDNGQKSFYALIRDEYNIQLIEEAEDPDLFKIHLGFKPEDKLTFETNSSPVKIENGNFNDFFNNIAKERSGLLRKYLDSSVSKVQVEELWKVLGNSSVPLDEYNEYKAIDLRSSIRTLLNIGSNDTIMAAVDFSKITRKYMLNDLKIDSSRLLDPSFELAHELGEVGLRSIRNVLKKTGKQSEKSSEFKERTFENLKSVLANPSWKIGEKFGVDVHVKSLSGNNNSGYGYEFVKLLDGKDVELRTVHELDQKMPVVPYQITEDGEQIYNAVDPKTGNIVKMILHIKSNEVSRSYLSFGLLHYEAPEVSEETDVCEKSRRKRAPATPPLRCIRAQAFIKKDEAMKSAVRWARQHPWGRILDLSEEEIIAELKKYVFPEIGELEKDFVRDWFTDVLKRVPNWSAEYRIREHETFFRLRYHYYLEDVEKLTYHKVGRRLRAIDPVFFGNSPTDDRVIETILWEYKNAVEQIGIHMDMNLEDYWALEKLKRPNNLKILTSDERRQIRMALYRLAIRQSDDLPEAFPKILYKGERRFTNGFIGIHEGAEFEVEKFWLTGSHIEDEAKHAEETSHLERISSHRVQTIFEMKFEGTYLRAKVRDVDPKKVVEAVLLPGTRFRVTKVWREAHRIKNLGIGPYVKIEMEYVETLNKLQQKQMVMEEISILKNTGTRFHPRETHDMSPEDQETSFLASILQSTSINPSIEP